MPIPTPLAWALHRAREQTHRLASGFPPSQSADQATPGERHPEWILGHLCLGDAYLLSLLGSELPADFPVLLARYGPDSSPQTGPGTGRRFPALVERLGALGVRRHEALSRLTPADLGRALPDPVLARAQPTLGHHLHALLAHEGYHAGQLAAWRKGHGVPPVSWAFATPAE